MSAVAISCALALLLAGAQGLSLAGSQQSVAPDPVVCKGTVCGELACPPPGKVKHEDSCCPVCEFGADVAPTYDPAEMQGWYDKQVSPNEKAPSECKGAYCGTPLCAANFKAHHAPGDCCPKCVPSGF